MQAYDAARFEPPAPLVLVTVKSQQPGIEIHLLIDSWHGVLGRNILNSLSLLFDGPSRKWMEQR